MFNLAVSHIANYLNQFLQRQFELHEDIVVVSNLVGIDGASPIDIQNRIVISIINIEKDHGFKNQRQALPGKDSVGVKSPPLYINFNIIVSANFAKYSEGLKLLSATCQYFQIQPVFDHHNSPDLDANIHKLILEFENLSLQDLSSLWSIIGGKYLPSVIYKLRTVILNSDNIIGRKELADSPSVDVGAE
ncbi:DUF4255 domain-containing protein [Thalassotalea atypica]|uniref:DUF4255 domain-containing protein n=1 Tax=Thalassotalea atypica TaxID=2054316 RepID=UPI002572268A|nr:DUF4255 domain-containing protein [Thalassotalea atypica]